MKVVAFNGSPRKGGNTEMLLNRVLEPIRAAGIDTELIQVGGKPIRGCLACYECMRKKNFRCSNNTDEVTSILAKWLNRMRSSWDLRLLCGNDC